MAKPPKVTVLPEGQRDPSLSSDAPGGPAPGHNAAARSVKRLVVNDDFERPGNDGSLIYRTVYAQQWEKVLNRLPFNVTTTGVNAEVSSSPSANMTLEERAAVARIPLDYLKPISTSVAPPSLNHRCQIAAILCRSI